MGETVKSSIWHDSREYPKDQSSIIIVHDYFNYGKDSIDTVQFHEDYKEYFNGRTYHHYNVFIGPGRYYDSWDKWMWKIKKWCYTKDFLKIK